LELAADLLVYFGKCPACRAQLDFEPRVAAALAESRQNFIRLYGQALTLHYGDHPHCQEVVRQVIRQKPYAADYIMRRQNKLSRKQVKKWLGWK
jgi:hypothetical protein